jgi:hypothetical protein
MENEMNQSMRKKLMDFLYFLSVAFSIVCLFELKGGFIYSHRYWNVYEWADDFIPALAGLMMLALLFSWFFFSTYMLFMRVSVRKEAVSSNP